MNDLSFVKKIEQVRKTSGGVPRLLNIDLSVVEIDHDYGISGNLFYVIAAPDGQSYINVRINETRENAISFYQQMGLETPFHRLFITTPAGQTGTMSIIYATEAPEFLQVIDNRSATSLDLEAIRAELQGDTTEETWDTEITVGNGAAVEIIAANADRKGCIIQSKAANAGIVYIGFDNTVTTTKWIAELSAGMSIVFDDYRGDLYARASAAGQLVGWGEW